MRKTLLFLAAILFAVSLQAQRPPMKPGKVDRADVQMKYYPSDSTVDAAILCEYGKFNIDLVRFIHMQRIKIFTKEGLNNLIFTVPIELKSDFKGFVFNEVDGKVVKEKISRDHIFIERSEGTSRVRIAPPNVREGSVVDVSFNYDGFPSVWHFQHKIPVRYSELRIPKHEYFSFKFQQIGFEPIKTVSIGNYIARDMAAFRPEPYINSEDNYMTGVLIDLQTVNLVTSRGSYFRDYCSNWNAVNKYYRELDGFYTAMQKPSWYISDALDTIDKKNLATTELVSRALRVLHREVSWNEVSDMYPDSNLKEVWEKGTGTSADMNFIFMNMLNKLDVEFKPFIMSSRSRGRINPYLPTSNKFNYTIVAVQLPEETLLVDASDKYSPVGILPSRCINGGGLEIGDVKGRWVNYEPAETRDQVNSCTMVLDSTGSFTGQVLISHGGYGSISFRRKYDQYSDQDAYIEQLEKKYEGMFINKYENNASNNEFGEVQEKMIVEMEGVASVMGDMITFNPVLIERWKQNPFKLEKREYPVDFTTAFNEMMVFNIAIPEGYEIVQLPEPIAVATQDKSAVFQYVSNQVGQNLQLMVKFSVNKPVFYENEYGELKEMFNIVVEKEQENVILKKTI